MTAPEQPAADARWRREPWAAAAVQAMDLGREHGDVADSLGFFDAGEPEQGIDVLASLVRQKRLWGTPFEEAVSRLRSLVAKAH